MAERQSPELAMRRLMTATSHRAKPVETNIIAVAQNRQRKQCSTACDIARPDGLSPLARNVAMRPRLVAYDLEKIVSIINASSRNMNFTNVLCCHRR